MITELNIEKTCERIAISVSSAGDDTKEDHLLGGPDHL